MKYIEKIKKFIKIEKSYFDYDNVKIITCDDEDEVIIVISVIEGERISTTISLDSDSYVKTIDEINNQMSVFNNNHMFIPKKEIE